MSKRDKRGSGKKPAARPAPRTVEPEEEDDETPEPTEEWEEVELDDAGQPQLVDAPRERRRKSPQPRLIFADEHLLAVDKPSGLLSTYSVGDPENLPDRLRAMRLIPAEESPRSVHRLDKDTSGVLVFARSLAAQRNLAAQFAAREVEKCYWALVSGYVAAAEGEIDKPLLIHRNGLRAEIAARRGKEAITRWKLIERVAGNSLLECRPLTGRLHQIRVHLASIGHPLTVDPLYGSGSQVLLSSYKRGYRASTRHAERPLIERLTLHALRLTVRHPSTGQSHTFEAPLPRDFRATLAQLRRALPQG